MSQATRYTGKEAYVAFTPTAGTPIVLDTDYRSLGDTNSVNLIDASAGDDDWDYDLAGRKTGEFTITVLDDASVAEIEPETRGVLEHGPQGNAAGKRKISQPVMVVSNNLNYGYQDVAQRDLTFKKTGTRTVETYSS